MATLTRLASTLTAKYLPSQTLTDAFYMDGRLCGKRETRQADITIDKEERGFFFSVFTHPTIQGLEPGTLPPYEPQLREMCNEVKFGHKEIDGMIERFLSTAVDVTGKMRLSDGEARSPYFSGVIVRDSEAFAVTIGNGLAFLYRDDTLFPLTDAGVPMEPIDSYGNRVGDFMYYCSSKTANALWSNFFTLSPDDCIILCNKAVYDALGQRELLRILTEAEDQCDAAGVVITQASARMPNVPMQFSISFVESVTSDERKGLFGFKKKSKEEDMSDMSIKSTFDGGVVGAAAEAIADAGFVSFATSNTGAVAATTGAVAAASTPTLSIDFGGVKTDTSAPNDNDNVEFLDTSVKTEPEMVNPEDVMKRLFGEMQASSEADAKAVTEAKEAAATPVEEVQSPFVVDLDRKPEIRIEPEVEESALEPEEIKMETVSQTPFTPVIEDEPTKPVNFSGTNPFELTLDKLVERQAEATETKIEIDKFAEPIIPAEPVTPVVSEAPVVGIPVVEEVKAEPEVPVVEEVKIEPETPVVVAPEVTNKPDEIVFAPADIGSFVVAAPEANAADAFNPYSVGDTTEMQNTAPLVFGDDLTTPVGTEEEVVVEEPVEEIPVPEFDIPNPKPELKEEDKLKVDFPEAEKVEPEVIAEEPVEEVVEEDLPEEVVDTPAESEEEFSLPFANGAETAIEPEAIEEVPPMPVYDGNTFDTPVNAVNSETAINEQPEDTYVYGQYEQPQQVPYQPYGGEEFSTADQNAYASEQTYSDPYAQQPVAPVVNDNQYVAGVYDAQQYAAPVNSDPNVYSQNAGYEGMNEYGNGGMNDYNAYPGGNGEPQASATSNGAADDDAWIMGILGYEDDVPAPSADSTANAYSGSAAPAATQSQGTTQFVNPQRGPNGGQRPAGQRPNGPRPGSPSGNRPRNGSPKMKLNRNGYIFLAFVFLLIVCLVFVISLIAKSCSNNDAKTTTASTSNDVLSPDSTEPMETVQTTQADPSAPIGYYMFSDYVGYRTWWDLFKNVYGIELSDTSDTRIATIITYNGQDPATYKPNSGDSLLLPPQGVFDGTIPVTFQVGGGNAPATTDATSQSIEGSVQITDGAAQPQ